MDEYGIIKKMIDEDNIQGLVFDFDGTLFTLEVDWPALKKELNNYLIMLHNITDTFSPISDSLFKYRALNHKLYKELLEIYHQYELTGYRKGKPNEQLISFMKHYQHKQLAIYSMNTQAIIDQFLKDYHLHELCNIIITQENSIAAKPTDEDLNKISDIWKLGKEEMIFIGNTQADADSGIVAGIKTILI